MNNYITSKEFILKLHVFVVNVAIALVLIFSLSESSHAEGRESSLRHIWHGVEADQWRQWAQSKPADNVSKVLVAGAAVNVRVVVGDKELPPSDIRYMSAMRQVAGQGYEIDKSAQIGFEVRLTTDIVFLSSGRSRWARVFNIARASVVTDALVLRNNKRLVLQTVILDTTSRWMVHYPPANPEPSLDEIRDKSVLLIDNVLDDLLRQNGLAVRPGVCVSGQGPEWYSNFAAAAGDLVSKSPARHWTSYTETLHSVQVDGVLPDFTGFGLMRDQNNQYLESAIADRMKNKGVLVSDVEDDPIVRIHVQHGIYELDRGVESDKLGVVITLLDEPQCLVPTHNGGAVWVKAFTALRTTVDSYSTARSGRYGLSQIAVKSIDPFLR